MTTLIAVLFFAGGLIAGYALGSWWLTRRILGEHPALRRRLRPERRLPWNGER